MEEYDNPGEILYLCKICGKDFAGPVTLKIHERVHIDDNSPQDHLQNDPKDLQDYPQDIQEDPQDIQDDPQKVHDDPLDLQDDPQVSFEPEKSLPISEKLEITMPEAKDSEIFKQDCFESFKKHLEGIGCDNVELQKAIDKLKLMNEQKQLETQETNQQAQYDSQPSTSQGINAAGFTRLVIPESDSDSENTGLFMTI